MEKKQKVKIRSLTSRSMFIRHLNESGPSPEMLQEFILKYPKTKEITIKHSFGNFLYLVDKEYFSTLYEPWKNTQLELLTKQSEENVNVQS